MFRGHCRAGGAISRSTAVQLTTYVARLKQQRRMDATSKQVGVEAAAKGCTVTWPNDSPGLLVRCLHRSLFVQSGMHICQSNKKAPIHSKKGGRGGKTATAAPATSHSSKPSPTWHQESAGAARNFHTTTAARDRYMQPQAPVCSRIAATAAGCDRPVQISVPESRGRKAAADAGAAAAATANFSSTCSP